jgi:hypothetical protein
MGIVMKLRAYGWQERLQEAIHEADPSMAEVRIRLAETAIFERVDEFSKGPDSREEQALFDALGTLRLLRSMKRVTH